MRQTDPLSVGMWLGIWQGRIREQYPGTSFHEIADMIPWDKLPEVDKNETLGSHTAKIYREELEQRASEGDRYAASMLTGKVWDEPNDSA